MENFSLIHMFCEEGKCVCNNFDDNRLGDIVDNIQYRPFHENYDHCDDDRHSDSVDNMQCIKPGSDLSMITIIIVTVIALITCSASNLVATFQGRCPTLDEAITNGRLILDIFNWDF